MSGAIFGGASGVRDVGDTASATSSVANLAYLIITLIIAAVVIGGGLVLFGSDISAVAAPSLQVVGQAVQVTFVRWPNKGWSQPVLPDHAELAASEQAQLEAAWARRGWRPIRRVLTLHFDKRTHRRLQPGDMSLTPDGGLLAPSRTTLPEVREPEHMLDGKLNAMPSSQCNLCSGPCGCAGLFCPAGGWESVDSFCPCHRRRDAGGRH